MRRAVALAVVAWLSLVEWPLFDRLLYQDAASVDFVLANVQGVLAGTPVWKSSQQRLVGPLFVSAIGGLTAEPRRALRWFSALTLFAGNLLLFALMRRRGCRPFDSLMAVVCLGLARLLIVYRLEYPWDGIDVLIFLVFGDWAARGGGLPALAPLLLLGAFNHETVVYLPLWYLLAPLEGEGRPTVRRQMVGGGIAAAVLAVLIAAARQLFYRGRPDLPGQLFEPITPVISNPIHVAHNLDMLLVGNWTDGRAWLSLGVLSAVALLTWLAARPSTRRAAVWSLAVIATIVCFGYTNETRHYLPLVAFWVPYAWPAADDRALLSHA